MGPRGFLKRRGLILAAIILFLVLLYAIVVPRPILVDTAAVSRGTFVERLQSDGVLRSKRRYIVPAFADGDIKRVDLRVGDLVKKGQAITELYWDIKYESVKSPIEGVISKVFRESAGPIRRGDPIVEVVDPRSLEAMAELLTTDAAQVRPGNPARVEGWGGSTPIEAEVARVSQAGFTKQSALGVEEEKTEVTMDLKEVPQGVLERLGSLFHVEISIEVARHEQVLVIPIGALFRDGDAWAVYRVEGGRAIRVPVVLASKSGGDAMISDGLRERDQVVVYPGDLVRDGSRVRSR